MLLFDDVLKQVECGIVKNWEEMEHLWNYTFYEKLQVRKSIVSFQIKTCKC